MLFQVAMYPAGNAVWLPTLRVMIGVCGEGGFCVGLPETLFKMGQTRQAEAPALSSCLEQDCGGGITIM